MYLIQRHHNDELDKVINELKLKVQHLHAALKNTESELHRARRKIKGIEDRALNAIWGR